MSKDTLRNLFISNEDAEGPQDTVEVAGPDSMEGDMLEVEESRQVVDGQTQDIEEMEEVADGLEAIVERVEASLEAGGLSEGEASMMQLAANGYMQRLGLESVSGLPSLESFGGASDRLQGTTVSVEAIKDTIKKIWQAIKTAVQRAITAIQNFFAKIFSSVDKIVSRAESLSGQVDKVSGSPGKIKASGLNSLQVGGKHDAGAIKKGLGEFKVVGDHLFGDYVDNAAAFYEKVGGVNSDTSLVGAEEEGKVDEAVRGIEELLVKTAKVAIEVESHELSGGYVIVSSGKGEGDSSGNSQTTEMGVPKFKKKGGSSSAESTEMDALSQADMKAILADVKGIAELVKGKKGALDKLTKARKDAVSKSEKLASAAGKEGLGKAWSQAKVSMSLRMVNRDLGTPLTQYCSIGFSAMRAALALVDKSVKAYGGKSEGGDE